MRTYLLIIAEALLALCAGCASSVDADNGAFIETAAVAKPADIEPQPEPISVDDIMPVAPIPHANCVCKSCKCDPVCVGACAEQPAAKPAAKPQMKCVNGQCYPVRRGLFGWRR